MASITTAGGVTVSGIDSGPFTIAFNSVGAQNYITGDLILLEPASVLGNIRKQTGDGSTKEIQVIRVHEGVLALQGSFSAIAAPTAAISTLVEGGSGSNEIQQLVINRECIGGLISLSFGGETTSFDYGSSADEVKESLEGNTNIAADNIAVTKISNLIYTFEFIGAEADTNQAAFTVDYSGLQGYSGFSGALDLDNYSIESFLNGSDYKECKLEIELTDGGNKTTLVRSAAIIENDVINSAVTSPPLSPSITFVESINGSSGVVVIDPDDLDDTSTTNKFVTSTEKTSIANSKTKTDYLTVTGAIDLDSVKTKNDYLTVTQAVDLDDIESKANSALQNISEDTTPQFGGTVDAQNNYISNLLGIGAKTSTTLTISTGAVTQTQLAHAIANESAAATDDLNTIVPATGQTDLFLTMSASGQVPTIKHATGTNTFLLASDTDLEMVMNTIYHFRHDGTNWKLAGSGATGGGGNAICFLKDVKAYNVNSASVAGHQVRDINTLEGDTSFVSLSSNRFTLDAGDYDFFFTLTTHRADGVFCYLYNYTDTSLHTEGSPSYAGNSTNVTDTLVLEGELTSNGTDEFEVRQYAQTAFSGGLGRAHSISGYNSVFLNGWLRKK